MSGAVERNPDEERTTLELGKRVEILEKTSKRRFDESRSPDCCDGFGLLEQEKRSVTDWGMEHDVCEVERNSQSERLRKIVTDHADTGFICDEE